MTQNTKQMLLFKDIFHKKVVADFNGGDVSSDAGLLFLNEVEHRIKLIKRMVGVLRDKRHSGYVKHQLVDLMKQRVFQVSSGYEDANDSDDLKNDPIMKIVCEKPDTSLASQPTMSRFENSLSRTELYRIAQVFVDVFIDSYKRPPEGIILDIDDTEDKTHGSQQLSFFNAYHQNFCYMPLHIYEGNSGKLITTVLRTGKVPSGKEITMILKRIVHRIREAWPHVGIIIRGDSHYAFPELFSFCESLEIKYIFGITLRKPMLKKAEKLSNKAREFFDKKNESVKLFGEFFYQAQTWETPQRIIYKAEHNDKGPNLRAIVTNLENNNRRMIYEVIFSGRGAMELMIKEHKNHLRSDKTSCSSFLANQFRLFIHSMAYVLLHAFREKCLQNTQFAKAQFDTIRLKILKLGARVLKLSRKIKIHLPSSCPYQEDLFIIWQACIT
jgi:hypothetical protein